uniref:Uncharacterized protein n=1 Tax=Polynucleobacter necessarius subsp. necessarius (strain STIR1) TaxID=452638 RepID=B1XVP5_POLNS
MPVPNTNDPEVLNHYYYRRASAEENLKNSTGALENLRKAAIDYPSTQVIMNCPYCLSEVSEEAYVCKTCSRDLYLFKPMMAKISALEEKLATIPSTELYELRIAELEHEATPRIKSFSEDPC